MQVIPNATSYMFKGTAKTYRTDKTNECTYWLNVQLVYNKTTNTLDGYGISKLGRKQYPFILIGTIYEDRIILYKIHPTIQKYISYTGTLNKSAKESKIDISLISSSSYGSITLIQA